MGLSLAFATTKAGLGAGSQLFAGSLTVEAGTNVRDADGDPATAADDAHVFGAEATSGAGGGKNSVAGSLAFNLVLISATATVGDNSLLSLSGGTGDVAITAGSKSVSTVKALPGTETGASGEAFGLGLSIALSIVVDDTLARLGDGVAVAGAHDVVLTAAGGHVMTTEAANGARTTSAAGDAVTPVIAVSVSLVTSQALIGSGGSAGALVAGGKIEARASQVASVTASARGSASAVDAAVGFSVAVTVAIHTTRATSARDLAADGDVTFEAIGASAASATAVASAAGAAAEDDESRTNADGSERTADEDVADQRGLASNQSARLGSGTQSRVDSAPDSPAAETSEEDSSGGESTPLQVAAAIAVTVAVSDQDASLPAGIVVGSSAASAGVVTLRARGNSDSAASASGQAVTTGPSTGDSVGAAVGLSLAFATTKAGLGAGSQLFAGSLTVEAGTNVRDADGNPATAADDAHVFGAEATSGAGGGKNSVAGSLAFNLVLISATATVGDNSLLSLSGGTGDVAITAGSKSVSTVKALPGTETGASGEAFGLGLSIALSIVVDDTLARLGDGVAVAGAHDVVLTAAGGHAMTTEAANGARTTSAAGDAVTPVIAVSVSLVTSQALIGSGGSAGALVAGGKIEARASQVASVTASARGSASAVDAAVGFSVAVTVAIHTTRATSARDLAADGDVTFEAIGASAASATAVASAAGAAAEDDESRTNADGSERTADEDVADQRGLASNQSAAAGFGHPVPGRLGTGLAGGGDLGGGLLRW